ncbi:MAG: hypothetical protein ABIU77_11935 [Ferruginibacter sp.]
MPLKKSALLLIALAISSVSVLVFSANKIIPAAKKINCCNQVNQNELFVPWNMVSHSMLLSKA